MVCNDHAYWKCMVVQMYACICCSYVAGLGQEGKHSCMHTAALTLVVSGTSCTPFLLTVCKRRLVSASGAVHTEMQLR